MRTLSLTVSALLFAGASFYAIAQDDAAAPEVTMEKAAPVVTNYKIDASKTKIYATTQKTGVGAALAHDHVIAAVNPTGSINFSAEDSALNTISVKIDVGTMSVDAADYRTLAGHAGKGPDASDRESITKNMLSEDQLNVGKYGTITFKSTSITHKDGDTYTVTGELGIRGVTKTVTLPTTVKIEGEAFHGTGTLKISHSMFGFEPYSAAFGAIGNADEITLHLDIWGKK